jgi:hypothetical protein
VLRESERSWTVPVDIPNDGRYVEQVVTTGQPGEVPVAERVGLDSDDLVGALIWPGQPSDDFVVVLGGSGGGIPEPIARRVAESGKVALALGYFGAPGCRKHWSKSPLNPSSVASRGSNSGMPGAVRSACSAFPRALSWLCCWPPACPGQVGATVAVVPSSPAWFGLDMQSLAEAPGRAGPAWAARAFLASAPAAGVHGPRPAGGLLLRPGRLRG